MPEEVATGLGSTSDWLRNTLKLCSCLHKFLQISMSGELTTAKTHLATLQNEVASLRQKEAELSTQLSKVTSEADKYRHELTRVKDSHTGLLTHYLLR